jgi:hypothetical protein
LTNHDRSAKGFGRDPPLGSERLLRLSPPVRLCTTERPRSAQPRHSDGSRRRSAIHVRRDKAALSGGCKAHPAIRSRRKQSEQSWR